MEGLVPKRHKLRKRRNIRSQEHSVGPAGRSRAEQVDAALRRDSIIFAAKVRGARAILGWSQRDLGNRVSMTQKSIYRMEQGGYDMRRSTVVTVEEVFKLEGIAFEELPGGGF